LEWIGYIWDLIILNPMINVLIMLSSYLGGHFGITIILLTIVVNLLMYPLTVKQLKASKAMQEIQAQVAEVRKKYEKDKQKAAQEQMRLMKESGMNPLGCLVPMLIQLPVWIALYQSIIRVLAVAPEDFLGLSQRLYSSWPVFSLVPLNSNFLWLNLAAPDPYLILPILVGGSMWVQQKMATPTTTDPKQQAQSQMMLWMMPLMFAFLTLSFPSGLALYWVTSTVIRIAMQYFISGWGGLASLMAGKRDTGDKKIKGRVARQEVSSTDADLDADIVIPSSAQEEGLDNGKSGGKRQDRRGSYPTRLKTTRRKSGGSGSQRRKRR
jgi:YidC/Oxa1 family membrane protein insertase